ncbi:MAG: DMT family transporter [Treponema sp.]
MNTNIVKILSRLALLTTAIVWGSSLVVVSLIKEAFAPNMVLAIRFSVGSIVLALIFAPRFKHYNLSYLINGVIIGIFLFIAYSSQTIGVTTAGGAPGRSGFISASYCVIVPFLAWFFLKERPDIYNISAAILCVTGLFFVFYKDLVSSANVAITSGDLYALLSGVLFAAHIVSVAKFGKGKDPILITITQFVVAAIISIFVTFLFEDNSKIILDKGSILGIGYLAIMCTAVALLFQTIGQSNTPSSTAAIILGLESIFSIIFAVIWADEKLSFFSVIGFFFIFIAILVSETKLAFLRKKKQ